jgi:membrane protease YdiL (CAAX protease family)
VSDAWPWFSIAGQCCFIAVAWLLLRKEVPALDEELRASPPDKRDLWEVLSFFSFSLLFMTAFWVVAMNDEIPLPGFRLTENIFVHFHTLGIAVALVAIQLRRRYDARALGLHGFRRGGGHSVAVALIMALVWGLISLAVATPRPLPGDLLVYFLLTPALLEELEARSVYQVRLERRVGVVRAALLSGLLFGLLHIPTDFYGTQWAGVGQEPGAALLNLLSQTLLGIFWGLVFARSRSIWPGVVAHYLNNFLPAVIWALAAL